MNNYYKHESSYVDDGAVIGQGTKIWHFSHIMSNARVGDNCIIGQNVFIGAGVVIGDNVKIQNNVSLYSGVVIEDDVFIGPSVVFTNVINPRSLIDRKSEFKATVIKRGASLGANSTIICGNSIGMYAMVGAGAVITKSVYDYELAVGNPARTEGWMSEAGCRLRFDEESIAVCVQTKERYQLMGSNEVIKIEI